MTYTDFFQKAKEKGITNIQVTEKHTIDSSVEIIDGKIESFDDYHNLDYSIKAEYNGKTVKTESNYLEEEVLDQMIQKAEVTDSFYEDDYLEKRETIKKQPVLDFDISEEIKKIKDLENSVENMKYNMNLQRMVIRKQEERVEEARRKMDEAMKERKTYEKLKEKAFEQFLKELDAAERKEIDELVSFRYQNAEESEV